MKNGNDERSCRNGEDLGKRPVAQVTLGADRTLVELELTSQGRDYLLRVTGGQAHVGAVAVWDCARGGRLAAVNQMHGHREGPLAGECAEILGRATGRTVVAVVGIHQDEATRVEIETIVALVRLGAEELARPIRDTATKADRSPGFRS